ncbi:MAG: FAD-dependent oxidoreductase [Candidatus Taylorbacteria bacterium]|nr:FAD-dependent oxidoreductase [Candidatus Taylorbacteria bacterium]
MYDLAILGGGPAGVAAGVYASRKRLKTIFITKDWGGQSVVSTGIENWIGTIKISGLDLAENLKKHLEAYAPGIVDIKEGELTEKIEKTAAGFKITAGTGSYQAKTLLVTTGSSRRKLSAKGADALEHRGITYCASCDGPLFAGKEVVVVGGGNAGFETAAQLLAYCPSVTMIHRSEEFKADPVTVDKVLSNPKMKVVKNAEITEVRGDKFVTGIVYLDKKTNQTRELPAQGIFVEIGSVPNTAFLSGLVNLNQYGQIVVDAKTQRASLAGIWAAGDATDGLYHQNNIAAGDAVKALEDIYLYLHADKK